ncbi:DUF721 domain-containing protein [Methylomonas sp. LL1]|uniref:DciA family protein n=1 Tax=Methylomonas sp. LL1 TaxID=2785785 RepID=UPI0018C39D72|nr:DciA family protein [Methylomonas sp. LL1]QPK62498.1 DUF721 domain-containing protein [Methylomonas sp. LL1]
MNHSKKPVFKSALDFDGGPLALCLEKIAEQKVLLRVVQAAMPAPIAEHALHCLLNGSRLLIYTDSAAWASQIRFFRESILNKMQQSGQRKITNIQVKILLTSREMQSDRTANLPSTETVQAILRQVDQKSNDVLDLALSRLAKTLRKRLED